jgi:hypothetical protein
VEEDLLLQGGGVQGPLRTNTAGTAGSATVSGTVVTSGTFKDSAGATQNVTSNTSGPTGVFNSSGNGATGSNNGNCGGDNCQIAGSNGAASYAWKYRWRSWIIFNWWRSRS